MLVMQWNENLAVQLPPNIVQTLNLKVGDEVDILPINQYISEKKLLIEKREAKIANALQKLDKFKATLPKDFKFNRDEQYER